MRRWLRGHDEVFGKPLQHIWDVGKFRWEDGGMFTGKSYNHPSKNRVQYGTTKYLKWKFVSIDRVLRTNTEPLVTFSGLVYMYVLAALEE